LLSPSREHILGIEIACELRSREFDLPLLAKDFPVWEKVCSGSQLQLALTLLKATLHSCRNLWSHLTEELTILLSFLSSFLLCFLLVLPFHPPPEHSPQLHFYRKPGEGRREILSRPGELIPLSPLHLQGFFPALVLPQLSQKRLRVRVFPFNFIFHHFYPFWMVHI
jgi:hypothetical protein